MPTPTKSCSFCKAKIPAEAIRCKYCTSWIEQPEPEGKAPDNANVVYILDRGLVKFGKFATAILAIFLVVGIYVWGLDLKDNQKNLKETEKEVRTTRDEIGKERESIKKDKDQIDAIKNELLQIQKESLATADGVKAIVSELEERAKSTRGQFDWITVTIRQEIVRSFSSVLSADQYSKLENSLRERSARTQNKLDAPDEVLRLVQADVRTALEFYKRYGIVRATPEVKIETNPNFLNSYWDGSKLVYGMAFANGDIFGPYDPTVVFHEITHSLFSIAYVGQSSSVAESLCDVIAVLIARDGTWTIGKLRHPNGPPQALRSLSAPGTAYDLPTLGKDPQVDHLSQILAKTANGEDTHINSGILNKAAYLLTKGGEHHGVTIKNGIGEENAAKLYMAVITKLMSQKEATIDFATLRNLVVRTAAELLPDQQQQQAVVDGFRAVGL